jgi:hypothetical protein
MLAAPTFLPRKCSATSGVIRPKMIRETCLESQRGQRLTRDINQVKQQQTGLPNLTVSEELRQHLVELRRMIEDYLHPIR